MCEYVDISKPVALKHNTTRSKGHIIEAKEKPTASVKIGGNYIVLCINE